MESMSAIQTEEENGQVGDGEREEIAISGRVHRRVAYDHDAHGEVAHHAGHEDEHVNDGYRHDHVQRQVLRSPVVGQVRVHVEQRRVEHFTARHRVTVR